MPDNVVTNDDLTQFMDTSDEWIKERTGIEQRRWIKNESTETTATMGVEAAKIAIERSGLNKDEIDFIVFATLSPDYYFPGPGVQVQEALNIKTVGAIDVRNQCSGFVYGLSVADQFIKTGMYKNVLVIGSELQSRGIDKSTRGRNISVILVMEQELWLCLEKRILQKGFYLHIYTLKDNTLKSLAYYHQEWEPDGLMIS